MSTKMTHRVTLDGTEAIRGDKTSISMIYGNLTGVNRSDWQTRDEYLDYMEYIFKTKIRGKQIKMERISK